MTEQIPELLLEGQTVAGDPAAFAIRYAFTGEDRMTEVGMFVDGANILSFVSDGARCTLRWAYLEDLVAWLKDFAVNMHEDPLPVEVDGEFAKDRFANALESGPEDDDEFEEYAWPLWEWTEGHSWLSERAGAILSDVYFELKDGMVELSWDNRSPRYGVTFDCICGGGRVEPEVFRSVVLEFVEAYERHWGIKVDDDSTWLRKG